MYENTSDENRSPINDAVDLFAGALRFRADGAVHAGARRMADGDGDWQLAMFHAETDADVHADHWEVHPAGDEAVCCARGAIRVYLRATNVDGNDEVVTLCDGQSVVVPRGRWHRLELDEASDLMVVTRREGTRLERRTAV